MEKHRTNEENQDQNTRDDDTIDFARTVWNVGQVQQDEKIIPSWPSPGSLDCRK